MYNLMLQTFSFNDRVSYTNTYINLNCFAVIDSFHLNMVINYMYNERVVCSTHNLMNNNSHTHNNLKFIVALIGI